MEKVQILMSAYNGEKYLRVQLDSILNQTYQNIEILIRDDGSSDGTAALLSEYAGQHSNIRFYSGKNIGVMQSFFELLHNSDDCADYYALADQDDEWMPEKIECAVRMLKRERTKAPLLYCSDTYIADENLNMIKKDNKNPAASWGNALVQNICTGCTSVMNKSLRDIVKQTAPKQIVMHDWWLYLTAELFGRVCYDQHAYIMYRQHGNNVYGAKKNRLEVWRYRFGQLFAKRGYLYPQLEEVKKWYPGMTHEKRAMLEQVLCAQRGFAGKVRLIRNRKIYRTGRREDLVYRAIALIGKL